MIDNSRASESAHRESQTLTQGLFRREVIDAKRGEWLGSIIVAAPLSRWLITLLASVLAAAILLFLCFGHYTSCETVSGTLVPNNGLLNIAAHSADTITRLHVHNGQQVEAGDVPVEISSDQDSVALGVAGGTHALIAQQLNVQRSWLQTDLSNRQQISV